MHIDVAIWLLANTVSFIVSLHDLFRRTFRAWRWARRHAQKEEIHRIAKRNMRASLFKFMLATTFVLAGVVSVSPIESRAIVWLLVSGAVILSADIVLEARYRGNMFNRALDKADEELSEQRARRKNRNSE